MKAARILRQKKALIVIGFLIVVAIIFFCKEDIGCLITNIVAPEHPCTCHPDMSKNKVVVVIAKDGIYDNVAVSSAVSEYYASVKKDLNIGNPGLKKFPGETIEELNTFVDALYVNDDIAYIIFVGEDLPVGKGSNTGRIGELFWSLECVGGDCGCCRCSDVAVSYILPPFTYTNSEKVDFILKTIRLYADYHNNFDSYMKIYPRNVFQIADYMGRVDGEYIGLADPSKEMGYNLPFEYAYNTEYKKISDSLKKKHLILYFIVHGSPETGRDKEIGIIGKRQLERLGGEAFLAANHTHPYTSMTDEYIEFMEENGLPSLFVEGYSCSENILKSPQNSTEYCCWPQATIDTGAWAFYAFGGTNDEIARVRKAFTNEQTLGLVIRKYLTQQDIIFGDILAHMK